MMDGVPPSALWIISPETQSLCASGSDLGVFNTPAVSPGPGRSPEALNDNQSEAVLTSRTQGEAVCGHIWRLFLIQGVHTGTFTVQ